MSFEFVFFLFRFFLFFYPSFVVYLSSSLFSFSLLRVVCFLFRPRSCYALLCLLDVHPLHTTIGFPSCSLLSCPVLLYRRNHYFMAIYFFSRIFSVVREHGHLSMVSWEMVEQPF